MPCIRPPFERTILMGWTPLRDYAARRIAIIKPSSLGDIVHSLPVLSALRQRYPAAHICWVVNANYETLLTGHPDLDATLPLDRRAMRRGWMTALHTWRRFIHELRRQKFDLVVDLQGLLRRDRKSTRLNSSHIPL